MQTLTIGTFNIRYDGGADGPTAWTVRRDRVRAVIESAGFDLLGIQEALAHQADFLDQPGRWEHIGVGREDGVRDGEFAAIFFDPRRLKLLQSGTFWLSETPEIPSRGWDAVCTRICTWAQFQDRFAEADTPALYFFNCHLDHVATIARERAVDLLLQRIGSIPQECSLFLVGDFNMTVEDAPLQRLNTALTNAITITGDQRPVGTFTGFSPSEAIALPIDHLFITGPATIQRYTVLPNGAETGHYISDHRPITVTVTIGNRFPNIFPEKPIGAPEKSDELPVV